jgi:hypothetical protein
MPEFRRLKKTALTVFACFKRNQQFQMPLSKFWTSTVQFVQRQRFLENREGKHFGKSNFHVPVRFIS